MRDLKIGLDAVDILIAEQIERTAFIQQFPASAAPVSDNSPAASQRRAMSEQVIAFPLRSRA